MNKNKNDINLKIDLRNWEGRRGQSFLKTDSLPPRVLEDTTSVCLPRYNDEQANLVHQKNRSDELKLHLHSITRIPNHSRSKDQEERKRAENFCWCVLQMKWGLYL